MSNLVFAIHVVVPLFMLIVTGYVARCMRFVSDSFWQEANRFVFRFPLPLMLFQNVRAAFQGEFTGTRLMISAFVGIVAVIILLTFLTPLAVKRKGRAGSLIQGMYRSNFIIYGLPLAQSMYGDAATVPVACLLGVVVPVYNVSAIIILTFFSETRSAASLSFSGIVKNILRNPLIIACIAGGIVGATGMSFTIVVESPIEEMAKLAAPLALFVMGAEFRFRNLRSNLPLVVVASLAKLIFIPLVAILIFIAMGFRQMDLAVLLCLFATPTAVMSFIMSDNMGCDGELSAQIVVLTTALSAFTIFLFIFVLRTMGYL